jgi:hypothetical protein
MSEIETFAARIKAFNRKLAFKGKLPPGIAVLNPFRETPTAQKYSELFYDKFYADGNKRWPILGINPGRHGGGLTGVPFTDWKRLRDACAIPVEAGLSSHEPSSEFVYCYIAALGGPAEFYQHFYISSLCPLGFIREKAKGRWVNYNYYDDPALYTAAEPFIIHTLKQQIALGLHTEECFVMGVKNYAFFKKINEAHRFFDTLTELPHPRFIVQYRRREMDAYVGQYASELGRRMS